MVAERFNPSPRVDGGRISWQVMDQLMLLEKTTGNGRCRRTVTIDLSTAEARALRAWLDIAIPPHAECEQAARDLYTTPETCAAQLDKKGTQDGN